MARPAALPATLRMVLTSTSDRRRRAWARRSLPITSRDKLFRDSIVYLTVLHESGHALGLPHTRGYDDIMYSFAYGGDIVEYFARYRRKLEKRETIASASGLSDEDIRRVKLIYSGDKQPRQ